MSNVNHPDHYNSGGLEVVDIWRAKLSHEELIGAFKSNVLKYILRADMKNGLEDYKKAQVYMNWLVEAVEESTK